jgi:large subunit ribosomal protein L20
MRVKGGPITRQRRKAIKKKVSGAWGTKHTSFRTAKQTLLRSADYAYTHRKARKRDFRKLWNLRINAAIRPLGYNYSTFIDKLHKNNILINRKMLSELAINEPEAFKNLVEKVMKK